MSNYVTEWIAVELPRNTRSIAEILARYGLPETYGHAIGMLVGLLVSTGRRTPPGDSEVRLMQSLGEAFHDFGAGNPDLGFKYMQAAYVTARDVYCFDLSELNVQWSGIGRWCA